MLLGRRAKFGFCQFGRSKSEPGWRFRVSADGGPYCPLFGMPKFRLFREVTCGCVTGITRAFARWTRVQRQRPYPPSFV